MRLTPCKVRDLKVNEFFFYKADMYQIKHLVYREGFIDHYECVKFDKDSFEHGDDIYMMYGIYDVARVELPKL